MSNAGDMIDAGIFDHLDDKETDKLHRTVQDGGLQNSFSDMSKANDIPPSDHGQKAADLEDMKIEKELSDADQQRTKAVKLALADK